MKQPKRFHFIFGLKDQIDEFHIVWYVCLKSCLEVNQPDQIYFHYKNEPHGPWWEKIKPYLTLIKLDTEFKSGLDESKYLDHKEGEFILRHGFEYAHQADVIRLQILAREGGVYADIDTLFVRPYPDQYYLEECLLGKELSYGTDVSLCNAVIMAQQNAPFINAWLANLFEVFDGTWNRHSCVEAAKLSIVHPEWVQVIDKHHFFNFDCTVEGLAEIFAKSVEIPQDLYSIHLWSHMWWDETRIDFVRFHSGMLTENFINTVDTTFNLIARRYLD
jgi:hypothetical protein